MVGAGSAEMARLGDKDRVPATAHGEGGLGAGRAATDDHEVEGFHRSEYSPAVRSSLISMPAPPIDPRVRIGHVHLKVADLDRAVAFYRDVLGFELQQMYGSRAAFLSAGGYHHHIGLNTWESAGGSPPPPGSTGLYHHAILYPDRRTLADAVRRCLDAGVELTGASDHGVSEAIYLNDPDGNGVELYRDRAPEEWPRTPDGGLNMVTGPLDVGALLAELNS